MESIEKPTLVTAPPGYTVIHLNYDDEEPPYWEKPIIAFYVGRERFDTTPVAVNGPVSCRTNQVYGVKQPDGRIVIPGSQDFSTLDAFREYAIALFRFVTFADQESS